MPLHTQLHLIAILIKNNEKIKDNIFESYHRVYLYTFSYILSLPDIDNL